MNDETSSKELQTRLKLPRNPTRNESAVIKAFVKHLRHARDVKFYCWPEILEKHIEAAKKTYLKLKDDELLLGVFDNAMFAEEFSVGTAITTKRMYWRNNMWADGASIDYADLPSEMKWEHGSGLLTFGKISELRALYFPPNSSNTTTLSRKFYCGDFMAFLRGAALVYGAPMQLANSPKHEYDIDELLAPHIAQLDEFVGLASVKDDLRGLIDLAKFRKLRVINELPITEIGRHLVFHGNPGTGKTTIARLIGRIYRALDLLPSGHCIETDRVGLVAEYIGQTATKTFEICQRALGGVLFIDEAYSLSRPNSDQDYGPEAIEVLLKFMEDHRNDLVVIVAGYPHEMEVFLNTNPGLRSRFNQSFSFQDYNSAELAEIYTRIASASSYHLAETAKIKLLEVCSVAYASQDKTFGNGRFSRKLFERTVMKHARRLASHKNPDRNEMMEISPEDIDHSF